MNPRVSPTLVVNLDRIVKEGFYLHRVGTEDRIRVHNSSNLSTAAKEWLIRNKYLILTHLPAGPKETMKTIKSHIPVLGPEYWWAHNTVIRREMMDSGCQLPVIVLGELVRLEF